MMILKKFNITLSGLINIILLVLLTITLTVSYFRFESLKKQIDAKNFEYNLDEVNLIATQIENFFLHDIYPELSSNQLKNNSNLQNELNSYLNKFASNRFKNIFILTPPIKGSIVYQVIGNGTLYEEELLYGSYFEPYSEDWNIILKTNQASYFKKGVEGIWFTYQYPILQDHKLLAIITIDFSLENYKQIKNNIEVLKNAVSEYIYGMFVVVCFLIILSIINFQHISREKKFQNILKVKNSKLEIEKHYMKTLQDINPNILIVMENENLLSVNQAFLDFFYIKNIEEFTQQFGLFSTTILSIDDKPFEQPHLVENMFWPEYLYTHKEKSHILKLRKDNQVYYFHTIAAQLNGTKTLLVLQDITELEQKNKVLQEESKLISMAELLKNISHQWRQPLSIISAAASGVKMQKEFGELNDTDFFETCDLITTNATSLSQTIDDFKDLLLKNNDDEKSTFSLNKTIKESVAILEPLIDKHEIEIILNVQKKIRVYGKQILLKQAIINILNNAIDALEKVHKNKRVIFIYSTVFNSQVIIKICDSGKGIDEKIIYKIFEPYFTTKHQSQGTGLGLYFTHNNIVKAMNGSIKVSNGTFEHKKKKYYGAEFIIKLDMLEHTIIQDNESLNENIS